MTAWKIFLHGKEIDKVFGYEGDDVADVKRSLVNHDGYDSAIVVKKERGSKTHMLGFAKGTRVELHPGTDRWMMGDRYGKVTGHVKGKIRVKLDKSGRSFLFNAVDLTDIRDLA